MNKEKKIKVICPVNPKDNGGESVTITTTVFWNGSNVYYNTEIGLESYGNSASINLSGAPLTPEFLRDMANQIESATAKVQAECRKSVTRDEFAHVVSEVNKNLAKKTKKSDVKKAVKKYLKS